MKKSAQLFVLMFSVIVFQSCGTKSNENANVDSDTTTLVVSEQTRKAEELTARHARLEAARTEKAEQRRVAELEMAKASATYKDASGKTVYYKAETDPSFIGGDNEMMKYLSEHVTYPAEAKKNGIEGTVFVDFIIDEKGKVRDVNTTDVVGENVDQAFKDEAARVVASMPAWTPGRHHGVPVDTKFSIPVIFQLYSN